MSHGAARIFRLLSPSALLAIGLVGAPTAMAGNPCFHGEIPARTTGTDTQIKVAPCAFAPTVTHVAAGSTVTFFNGPTFTHLITGANQAWGSRDAKLEPGQTVAYRFDEPGIYPYACALHPGMSGAIVVGAAEAAVAAPAPTDSTADAMTAEPTPGSLALVGSAAAGTGAIVGGAIARLAVRRRRPAE